jgi:hypothetical protein
MQKMNEKQKTIEKTDNQVKAFYFDLAEKHLEWINRDNLQKNPELRNVLSRSMSRIIQELFNGSLDFFNDEIIKNAIEKCIKGGD